MRVEAAALASASLLVGLVGIAQPAPAQTAPSSAGASRASVSEMTSRAVQLLTLRAASMLTPPAGAKLAAVRPAAIGMSPELASINSAVAAVLKARRAADRAAGLVYTRSEIKLRNVVTADGPNATTIMHAEDDTKLYFEPIPGAPPYQESWVNRTFTFGSADDGAQLLSTSRDKTDGPLPTTDVAESSRASTATSSVPSTLDGPTAATVRPVSIRATPGSRRCPDWSGRSGNRVPMTSAGQLRQPK